MSKYYIYRDPSRNKIGATAAPESRIEVQQGLSPWRDYVIAESDNEIEASHLEAYYKGFYRTKWDKDIYMNINTKNMASSHSQPPSEGTLIQKGTYFQESYDRPALVDKARDNGGLLFRDNKGNESFFTYTEVSKLMESYVIQKSQYNDGWYALPKAILDARERFDEERMNIIGQNGNTGEHYENIRSKSDTIDPHAPYPDIEPTCGTPDQIGFDSTSIPGPCSHGNILPEFQQIRDWATKRGLYDKGDPVTQMVKLMEELGETAKALLKPEGAVLKTGETREEAIIDGLGDSLVVLINLSHLAGYRLEDCLESAYAEIADRKGKMINGTYVKDA